jgi:integrase
MKNKNHPKKGDRIKVEPIRDLNDIKSIKQLLNEDPLKHLLFVIGINSGLRCGDILNLKIEDLENKSIGDAINIIENKTKKENFFIINKSIFKSYKNYRLKYKHLKTNEYIFQSQKGKNKPLTVSYCNNLVKKWAKQINLKGNYGTHSLRKTWGYVQRVIYGISFEIICKRFSHSNPTITMRYLGITDKEVSNIMLNEI